MDILRILKASFGYVIFVIGSWQTLGVLLLFGISIPAWVFILPIVIPIVMWVLLILVLEILAWWCGIEL